MTAFDPKQTFERRLSEACLKARLEVVGPLILPPRGRGAGNLVSCPRALLNGVDEFFRHDVYRLEEHIRGGRLRSAHPNCEKQRGNV
jgi:hypothetical protein